MDNRMSSNKSERGVALIVALLMVLVLSILASSIILVSQSQTWTVNNYRLTTQARYAAEAGVQRTMNWMINSYTAPATFTSYDMTHNPVYCNDGANCSNPAQAVVLSGLAGVNANYPDSTVKNAYHDALSSQSIPGIPNTTFSTYATLLRMTPGVTWLGAGASGVPQTWQITSRGNIGGVHAATVQVIGTFERTGTPIFGYGIFSTGTGCGAITLSGGGSTDSYNSAGGAYPAGQQNSGGDVGSNGNMNISGAGTTVNGIFYDPNGNTKGSCPPGTNSLTNLGGDVSGGITGLPSPVTDPTPNGPSPTPPTTLESISGSCGTVPGCTDIGTKYVALAPGQYGNLVVSGGTQVDFSAGTYNINSINFSGSSPLNLASGPVILNIAGTGIATAIDLSGGTIVNSGPPSNLQIVYGGTDAIILSGGSNSAAVLYAPNSPVTITGGGAWEGAIISSTFTDTGGSAIHYDRALDTTLEKVGNFVPVGFSWSKF